MIEENLKNLLKEHTDRQDEKHEKAIQEVRSRQIKVMNEVRSLLLNLQPVTNNNSVNIPAKVAKPEKELAYMKFMQPELARLEFPKFDGDHLHDWLFKCNQYYEFDETPETMKIKIASLHLEGTALQWHQNWVHSRRDKRLPTWKEYVSALNVRFGIDLHHDPLAELMKLKQVGPVQTYLKKFEELLNSVLNKISLTEDFVVSSFISGLKEELQYIVRMLYPKNLQQAVSLAKLQELAVENANRKGKTKSEYVNPLPILPTPNVSQNRGEVSGESIGSNSPRSNVGKPFKQRSNKEFEGKRQKCLCCWCDEKYSSGHSCRMKRLSRLEVIKDECGEEDEIIEKKMEGKVGLMEDEASARISLNALAGIQSLSDYNTMRVSGSVYGQKMHILIDSGSTHNFIDSITAERLGCGMTENSPVTVIVANGDRILCNKVCAGLKWKMQGVEFEAGLLVLPLEGCQMVLGIQWLILLGSILWNFKELRMEFMVGKKKVVLRGSPQPRLQLMQCKSLAKALPLPSEMCRIQFCSLVVSRGEMALTDVEKSNQELPASEQQRQLEDLLHKNDDVLQEVDMLTLIRSHDHEIILKEGTNPISERLYWCPAFQKDINEEGIKEMQKKGMIKQSSCLFSAPVVLVRKKDSIWRLCIDYRAINEKTIKDKIPIPPDELHGDEYNSKLDVRSGYHHIRMNEHDVGQTTFHTHEGHYEFLVMPFGLSTNATYTFRSLMNDVFKPFLRKYVLVFFDNILVYNNCWEAHLKQLNVVFNVLRAKQLYTKRSKCTFAVKRIDYLGHIISNNGVEMDESEVEAISKWPNPKTIKELRGFLGLTGYYRRFIKGYGMLAKLLTELLKRNNFNWTSTSTDVSNKPKEVMSLSPLLALPNFEAEFVIEIDTCEEGVGAVLMQEGRPSAYMSKTSSDRHRLLSVYKEKMLAIVMAIQKWRQYLLGKHFKIKSDHQGLKSLLQQRITHPDSRNG